MNAEKGKTEFAQEVLVVSKLWNVFTTLPIPNTPFAENKKAIQSQNQTSTQQQRQLEAEKELTLGVIYI